MDLKKLRTDKELFTNVYHQYIDTVYRICFCFLKNEADAKDAVQEVFIKLLNTTKEFEGESHLKAWLIVTSSNYCKNIVKSWWWKRKPIDETILTEGNAFERDELLDLILDLPEKYRVPLYMYYYEGYNSKEIAQILVKPDSTIRTYLQRAKKILKEELE